MKKLLLGLLAALMFCVPAFAHPPITVYVDGEKLNFDQPPIIKDDRTLVPMRKKPKFQYRMLNNNPPTAIAPI